METKSVIALQDGRTIRAVMCETGDYVDLAPRLHKLWKLDQIKKIIEEGNQESIEDDSNTPSDPSVPAVTFYNFSDFMRYYEKMFCEDYYIMDTNEGTWYYAGLGDRSTVLLELKIQPLYRKRTDPESGGFCHIHPH